MNMAGTVFTLYPTGVPIGIVFLFPDGDTPLYFINNVTTCGEGFFPVLGRCANPYGNFPDLEVTGPMDTTAVDYIKFLKGLGENPATFLPGEVRVCFILKARDIPSFIMVSNPTFKTCVGPGSMVLHVTNEMMRFESLAGQLKQIALHEFFNRPLQVGYRQLRHHCLAGNPSRKIPH
jgi:hypothetical protein